MQHLTKIAVFGGVYNNYLSLEATLDDARQRGAQEIYCLGDMGGFGPHPDRVFPILRGADDLLVMQGNYDHSIGNRLDDCACGYSDPRDNHFAEISYEYTFENTADDNKDWLRDLPTEFRRDWAGRRVLMAHGSPRRTNEFLWESSSPDAFLEHLLVEAEADLLFVTHTGIPWQRTLPSGKQVVNVGAIGRPANNGKTTVDYAIVDVFDDRVDVELHEVAYDHERLAREMQDEGLPDEFVETVLTGWWTTCVEILPAKERARGRY
ncbi:metallophosphoesterase family protein [Persicimonas caeni]|uniref:Metallophosphoesterase family protein n=1 Tax=Persicimonas caeni TaxID=2292766 RepID=A0A4Y6PRB5_PERCE|nr:metallophosphoesterase family protein [Persicimonas caeni]QDG50884.1 metallophosphoesterase family protein [Persicimonas caeni]QED32105.1 metallophosphoesterase family protein [Persicimonas caeni]